MIYATGGFAYGGVNFDGNFINRTAPLEMYPSSVSTTKTGWITGAGLEWALADNWSAKIEGLFYDLGSVSAYATDVGVATGFGGFKNFDVQGAIVRVGLNYRFH